jgi:phosphoribosylamine-glycine ligase
LLIGSGGREHALAWRLSQSPSCDKLFACPGNPGIGEVAELVAIDVSDHAAIIDFCTTNAITFVVVGPEAKTCVRAKIFRPQPTPVIVTRQMQSQISPALVYL